MRRLFAAVCCSLATGGVIAQTATAEPDPDKNKNAAIVTVTCGENTFDAVTIRQNAALALQLVDGSGVLVMVHITVVDNTTGEVLFEFGIPGFEHNGQPTTTCTAMNPVFPNALQTMEVVFRPA
jgi:hypothetical protein